MTISSTRKVLKANAANVWIKAGDATYKLSWGELRDAAGQHDKELSQVYTALYREAERAMERNRLAQEKELVAEEWRRLGFPLGSGFSSRYGGQIVQRAWEVRRFSRAGDGASRQVAYIVDKDRSDGTVTRIASPEFPDKSEGIREWIRDNYGSHDSELWEDGESGLRWFH